MNKIALYGIASALAFSFVACDDYVEPNPLPQTNPQEPVLKTDDVVVAGALSADNVYDLTSLNNSATPIEVATVTCTELPESYTLEADGFISGNGFARSTPLRLTVSPSETEGVYTVTASADDLQGAFYSGISKGPKAKKIALRMLLKTVCGNQTAYVGGPESYYGNYDLTVLPFPSDLVIEDSYYILGTLNDWSVADAVKFNHSDSDPYDDPVFTLKVDISPAQAEAGWWWKIVPQSTYSNGNWINGDGAQFGVETNGSEDMEGVLASMKMGADGAVAFEPGAGCIKKAGQWLITINLEEGTYSFTSAVDYLYTPGDTNGWNQLNSQLLSTSDYANYSGYAYLSPSGFKFCDAPDWDHNKYGAGAEEGMLSTDGGAGNLTVPEKGLYWCNVNTASLTYSLAAVSTIGVIGDATPAGWDASTPLTPSEDFLTWTGTIVFKGGEFKFRANDNWDINLGGQYENLTQGGDNMASPGEGTYEVVLNLSQLPYSCTLTKK